MCRADSHRVSKAASRVHDHALGAFLKQRR